MKKFYFDIGGTNIEYIVSNNGQEIFYQFPVLELDKEKLLDKIASIIDEADEEVCIGISSPTAVNIDTGYCAGISGIKEYGNFNLYDELQVRIKKSKVIKIKALNDGNAALLGIISEEYQNNRPHSAVMVVLGTGIGGAVYIDNKIFGGFNNVAGEFGYPLWNKKQNISQALSPVNIFKREFQKSDGRSIFEKYPSDKKVKEVIDKWLEELSKLISYISFFINPEVIVFNGGVFRNKLFKRLLKQKSDEYFQENKIDNISNTKISFFDNQKNYSLLGAKEIIDNE